MAVAKNFKLTNTKNRWLFLFGNNWKIVGTLVESDRPGYLKVSDWRTHTSFSNGLGLTLVETGQVTTFKGYGDFYVSEIGITAMFPVDDSVDFKD